MFLFPPLTTAGAYRRRDELRQEAILEIDRGNFVQAEKLVRRSDQIHEIAVRKHRAYLRG